MRCRMKPSPSTLWVVGSMLLFILQGLAREIPCRTVALLHDTPSYGKDRRVHHENVQLVWSNAADFIMDYGIGDGAYGQTNHAYNVTSGEQYAIKLYRLRYTEKANMLREIFVVQSLCGHRNIINLPFVVQQSFTGYPALVFEYVENIDFYKLLSFISPDETQFYLYEIISAVAYAHSKGIVHRDFKPANIVINNATRTLKIIDWGLSHHHVPGDEVENDGDTYYRAPEMLLGNRRAGFAADMWSVGCVFGAVLKYRHPIFYSEGINNATAQIGAIMKTLGSQGMHALNAMYNFGFDLSGLPWFEKVPWITLVVPSKRAHATPDALDLLEQLLSYDFKERITAADALQHPYFRGVQDLRREE